jgi:ectoine hydroxylase-related dioxygenase (phytanoyl-CoA dioxygenase family)
MALTQEQIDTFSKDGYLPYQKLLTDDEITLYRKEYDKEFELARISGLQRNLSAPTDADHAQQQAAPKQMLQIMQMCERNLHFRRLIQDPRILDCVQDLIGPNIMLFHDQALFKPAHQGGEVTWHQDNGYWHCKPANLVSCWITLDDVDEHNGAMQMIPGSHLTPVWHQKNHEKDVLFDLDKQVDKSKMVTVPLPAGACMFHHCQTLHHTNPNHTPRQRRAFAIHFMTPGTRAGNNTVMQTSFARPILRMSI